MNPQLDVIQGSIDTIIFDFGGVLFDIDYEAPVREFIKMGASNFDDLYSKSAQNDLFNRLERGEIVENEFWESLGKILQIHVDYDQMEAAWNAILIGMSKSRADWINRMQEKYDTYILSNTNSIHVRAFEQMIDQEIGIQKFKNGFDAVYYSNEIGMRKPDENIFKYIIEQNALDPRQTLFIDDSIQHVLGARSAGLHAFHLDLSTTNVEVEFAHWLPA
jgi:glucose-1-phosphatase